MKISIATMLAVVAPFAFLVSNALAQGKTSGTDPLTQLPLLPAIGGASQGDAMPPGKVCGSSMQAKFYILHNVKVVDAVNWYAAHLPGYKKIEGEGLGRPQIVFTNSEGTILVIVTGRGTGDPDSYSVAYERYTPGLSLKAASSLTTQHIVCK